MVRLGEVTNRTFVLPLLIFYPTSRCNSRCVSCDWWKQSGADDLTLDEIERLAAALPALGTRMVVFSGGEPLLRPEVFDAAQLFRERGMALHLLTSGVLLERFADEVAQHFSPGHRLARRDDRGALRTHSRRRRARHRRARRRAAAPDGAGPAGDRARDAAPRELSRAAAAHRPRQGDGPRSHFVSRRPTCRRSASAATICRSGESLALTDEEIDEFEALVERTITVYAADFESGFVAESPDKLRRLPRYYAALDGAEPFPAGVLQRAVGVGRGRGDGVGAAVLLSRIDRQHPRGAARRHRGAQPAGVPRVARRWREPGVRALRLLAEDVLEERAMGVMTRRRCSDTQRAFDGVAAGYDRSNAENPLLCAMRRARASDRRSAGAGRLAAARSRLRSRSRCGSAGACRAIASRRSTGRRRWWRGAAPRGRCRRRRIASRCSTSASTSSIGWAGRGALRRGLFELRSAQLRRRSGRRPRGRSRAASAGRRAGRVGDRPRLSVGMALYCCAATGARRASASAAAWCRCRSRAARSGRATTSPASSRRSFAAAGFTRVSLRALGLFVPPPYMQAFADRHPALVAALQRVEDRCGGWPGCCASGAITS